MDWAFSEEQEQIASLTREILGRELNEERMRTVDRTEDRFDEALYRTLVDAGVVDPSLGIIELCRVLIEVGRSVAHVPAAPAAIAAMAVARSVGPIDLTGKIATVALAEDLNPDLAAPTTRARREDGGFSISGTKTTVPAGSYADAFVVSASIDHEPVLLVVPRASAGVEVHRQVVTNTDREAVLELNDVSVPAGHQIGGADALEWAVDHLTVALCAVQLGVCERALELTAEYAKQRVQFDRPIATFQAVGQRLADAFIDVEGIRLTLWQAAWRLSEGLPSGTEIDTAKFWASDAGHRVAHTAVHVHGGVGIDLDYPLHRYFVAAKRIEFALGTATEHLLGIGRTMADEPA